MPLLYLHQVNALHLVQRRYREVWIPPAVESEAKCRRWDADVVLYGSRARGDAGAESDFDLLSIVPGPISPVARQAVSDAIYEVELERGIVVSCLVCSREQWDAPLWRAAPFRENIEREGIAL